VHLAEATMSDLTLHYFNVRAKGELIRLVLVAAGQEFVDKRYANTLPPLPEVKGPSGMEDWADHKQEMPLGQMPVLEFEGRKFCQQGAIARFLAKKFGLMGDNLMEEFLVDMVQETMWTDVGGKLIQYNFANNADAKKIFKEENEKMIPVVLSNVASWAKGKFVLGSKLSLADLAIMDVCKFMETLAPEIVVPEALKKLRQNAEAEERIADYLASRAECPP